MSYPCKTCLKITKPDYFSGRMNTRRTPMKNAALAGHVKCLKAALVTERGIKRFEQARAEAMTYAVMRGDVTCTKILIAEGPVGNYSTPTDFCEEESPQDSTHEECLRLVLEAGYDAVEDYTLVHSIKVNHYKCMRMLIRAGSSVNQVSIMGETPLMLAAYYNHIEALKVLLEGGANVNLVTPRSLNQKTVLHTAAERGHLECLKILIKAGGNVNTTACYDRGTPIISAAGNGYLECVKFLLESGASVNKPDETGLSALLSASLYSFPKVVDLLLKAGASVNAVDENGLTPLICAALYDDNTYSSGEEEHNDIIQCIKLLYKADAPINHKRVRFKLNALQSNLALFKKKSVKDIYMLLWAGGETLEDAPDPKEIGFRDDRFLLFKDDIPAYLLFEDLKLSLKHQCREAIRKHLLRVDPHVHLFRRVPQLGLPSSLQLYLLYDVTID